jgi:hypothetical protein
MIAILLAGIAAVVFVIGPAHAEYEGTRGDEERIRREIAKEEAERSRLEILARGLEEDPAVMERAARSQGAGKPGELRYVRGEPAAAGR